MVSTHTRRTPISPPSPSEILGGSLRKCDNDKKTNLTSQLNLSTGTNLGDLLPSLDKVQTQL